MGTNNAGYSNNVALGKLVLAPARSGVGPADRFLCRHHLAAPGRTMAFMWILDLRPCPNWARIQRNLLQIDAESGDLLCRREAGLYPAAAGPGLTAAGAGGILNGQFGGHLRWVKTFAGPNSSVAVVINGQTYLVNRALRFATTIDSNTMGFPIMRIRILSIPRLRQLLN